MATYPELLSMLAHDGLFNKIRVACWVAADTIRAEDAGTPNHTNRVAWAKSVFADTDTVARQMVAAVLAQNRAQSLSLILGAANDQTGASDAALQSVVDAAVNLFAI